MADIASRLYSANQVRQLDRIAIDEFGYSGIDLMESAGASVFALIIKRYPHIANVTVLCGPGNNGGDGYVVASLLRKHGVTVDLVRVAAAATVDAKTVADKYLRAGGEILQSIDAVTAQPDIIVDALLGSGIDRPPDAAFSRLIDWANDQPCPVIAIDVPSGLNGNTGYAYQPAIIADLTTTFIANKAGLVTADGPDFAGEVILERLSIAEKVYDQINSLASLIAKPTFQKRHRNSHKGDFGNLLVVGGDTGMLGAVLLTAKASLRTGVGLVNVFTQPDHRNLVAIHQPEIMTHTSDSESRFRTQVHQSSALVLGPGTLRNHWSANLFHDLLPAEQPCVWDAGALRFLATEQSFNPHRVLTPHPGEAAALLGMTGAGVQQDRITAATEISNKYGGVCVLKGVGTVIADANQVVVCDLGNPGMASAGMGDVLSGIIGALLATGMDYFAAASAGVWLHAASGDEAARLTGENSLIASDLIDALPDIIAQCVSR